LIDHLFNHYRQIIGAIAPPPQRVLEIGGKLRRRESAKSSLLKIPELASAERICLNITPAEDRFGIKCLTGNSNHMPEIASDSFDLVLSNAVLEHDRYFWKSIAEYRRVLRPGGTMIIGVPGFTRTGQDSRRATPTFVIHTPHDYYRYSEQAIREVFFDGFEDVTVEQLLIPPRLIGYGRKLARS
jgi:SAM-dependent methyltransferase